MFIVSAANSQLYQKDLVQKTATQLFEYGHDHANGVYTKPLVELYWANKYSNYYTKGMSEDQLADFSKAKL